MEPASGDYKAIIWADAPGGGRFIRHWSQRGRLRSAQEEAVRAHLYELRTESKAQYKAGAHELNLR